MQLYDAVRVCVHLVLENIITTNLKIVEVYEKTCDLVAPVLIETVGDLPLLQAQIIVFSDDDSIQPKSGYSVEKKRFTSDVAASLIVVPVDEKDLSQIVNCAIESTNKDGFILCRENISKSQRKHTININDFNHAELTLIFEACCGDEKIYLFRKKLEVPALEVIEFNNSDLNWVSELQMVMKNSKKKVLVVSQGDRESGLVGFINCIRKEPNGDIFRCLLIQDKDAPKFSLDDPFYSKQLNKNLVMNVLSNKQWGSYRHLLLKEQQEVVSIYGQIDVLNIGDLSSLAWLQLPSRKQQQEGYENVFVYYSSVNFRDVMVATGRLIKSIEKNIYEQDKIFGIECAGRLADGRRVMGFTSKSAFVTQALINKSCMWEVPDEWSLKEAASVPIVYLTVILAMYVNGRMKKGDTVLIHAGSGGVGLAAITMALYSGCTVFTTVGSLEKRKFLKSQFPQLSDKHIGNSRDTSFEHMVMRETNGRGVDIVLNSLSEEKLLASVRCMAPGGRFLEIGKYDLQSNNSLGMEQFLKMASFHGVMLDTMIFDESISSNTLFCYIHDVLADAIKSGAVRPLKTTVFDSEDTEQAFRYMASGKHTGKVLIKIREEEPNILQKPTYIEKLVKPCFSCRQNRTYIVIGGLGGFGLELIDWLIYNGAKNLVITSRNGVRTGYQAMRVRAWRKYNVNVEICTLPLVSRNEVKNVLIQANKLAPVGGIFNLAVILRDSLFSNMKVTDFETSLKPKAHVTRLLDEVSRELCPELEQFVVFSSVSCGRGNAGQTNYGMANSIMERICERRRKENLHGLAIQWGAVGDVGLVADMQEENIELVIGGTLQQKIRNCLEVLNTFLFSPHAVVSSMVVAEKRNSHDNSGNIIDTICNILGIRDRKTVSVHSTLAELGMDSMMAVEIKQILEQQFEIFLTSQDIRVLTVAKLQELSTCSDNLDKEHISGERAKETLGPAYQYLVTRLFGDEKFADDIIVRLPSLSQGDVLHKNSTIIVLPGVEGLASVLEPFAKNLYWNVFCLQYPSDEVSNSSISNLANSLIPEIKKCIRRDEKFMIAGYSFGSLIAMEVTCILEKEGYSGNLILIDGSPNYVKSMLLEVFLEGDSSDNKLQRKVLDRAVASVWPSESNEFTEKLNEISDWNDRVNLFIDYSNDKVYSKMHQKRTMCAVYSRTKTILSYEGLPEKSIKSPVALLRPTENPTAHVEEDYGLSKYCVEDISVHVVEGNHLTLLENEKIGNILSSITGNKAAPIIYTF